MSARRLEGLPGVSDLPGQVAELPADVVLLVEMHGAHFHRHPVWSGPPPSDFYRVDGDYRGSTDMILRWAACKWGIDEDVVRAQAWTQSKWIQGGPNPADGGGDKRTDRRQCVHGAFTALWNFASNEALRTLGAQPSAGGQT